MDTTNTSHENPPSPARSRVLELFALAGSLNPPFPPTEMFSEGWMLRLLLDAHHHGNGGIPIPVTDNAHWYSEARLASPFQPAYRGDPHGEGQTHADGVIGQFDFRPDTAAGLAIRPNATQFVVIEAKMGSKLAPGTSRVPWYDQAARNVAAMAWTVWASKTPPTQLTSVAFLVIAPADRIETEHTFRRYVTKQSIHDKVHRRIALYATDRPDQHTTLNAFYNTGFVPFIDQMQLQLISWEATIAATTSERRDALNAFYTQCLIHNGITRNPPPPHPRSGLSAHTT